ncbi:hypothetical protein L1049_027267 [Liquidambar formosana]|uniref:Uncharacterized protein n=1 Tax=Liquidambar formosana TaxID=63359 RepID=A0AAP0R356_LIQFO
MHENESSLSSDLVRCFGVVLKKVGALYSEFQLPIHPATAVSQTFLRLSVTHYSVQIDGGFASIVDGIASPTLYPYQRATTSVPKSILVGTENRPNRTRYQFGQCSICCSGVGAVSVWT